MSDLPVTNDNMHQLQIRHQGRSLSGARGAKPPMSQDESKMLCENKLNNKGYAIDA